MSFKELKSAFETEVKSFDEARQAAEAGVEVKDGNLSIPAEAYAAVQKHKKNIEELKTLMSAESDINELKRYAEQGDTEGAARFAPSMVESKSVASMLLDSPEYKEMVDHNLSQMRNDVELNFANISEAKDVYTAMDQVGAPGAANHYGFAQVRQENGLVQPLKLTQRVRDLFPVASTNATIIEYFKSTFTDSDNNAATVAERRAADGTSAPTGGATDVFGIKPKSSMGFEFVTDPIRLIAHWIPAHRNTLADKAQVRSLINDNLLYGLALEEDNQLLNGNGSGENLTGILNRAGIQTHVGSASDQLTDQVRRALTKVELAYLPATGLVVHPLDWEKLELQKAFANGNYMVTTSVTVGGQKRLWQVPVVSTPAIAEGTFLVGAFGQAAQVYDRERASIRVAEQHADFFVRNAVVFLAEERLGLTTPRPEGLVKGTFTTPVQSAIRTFETNPDTYPTAG